MISIACRSRAEWIDTITAEVSRARIAPAERAGVRNFFAPFKGAGLEVALEATTGWRFIVEELDRVRAVSELVLTCMAPPARQVFGAFPASGALCGGLVA